MKRFLCKTLCVLLTIALLCGASLTAFAADRQDGVFTSCGGDCAYCPTILIPGNFQSPTHVLDDDGNVANVITIRDGLYTSFRTRGELIRCISRLLIPLTMTLVLQADAGLSKAFERVATEILRINGKDNSGLHVQPIEPIRYTHCLAAYSDEEKAPIYSNFPLEEYASIAGEDHLYYFSYDSFGSITDQADELYAFIQNVKKETGHDRVNLLPCSQGATIAGTMIERYREEMTGDLHRIVLAIPALDGSDLLGKIFNNGFTKQDSLLYRDLFPTFMGDTAQAYALNLAIRLLPKAAVHNLLDALAEAMRPLIVNASCMWALIPASEYDAAYARYMTDGTRERVREEVEFFHRAQANVRSNLLYLQENGVEVFDLVDYDGTFYPLFDGWDAYNADNLIRVGSTSGGAVSCPITETLGENYVQQNTYCTCGGNHISPDRRVDASTGFLCETTFYFRYGKHEVSAFNDVFLRLATELLTDDSFRSVHSRPERYPQFNTARNGGIDLMYLLEKSRSSIDVSKLSGADRAELEAAYEECDQVLSQTVVDLDAFNHAYDRLLNILEKIGEVNAYKPSAAQTRLTGLLHSLSDRLYNSIGGCGFSDALFSRFKR